MNWLKENPEKAILLVVALLGVGLGIKHVLAVQAFPDGFKDNRAVRKQNDIPAPPEELVIRSGRLVEVPVYWRDKSIPFPGTSETKDVPLLRSVWIVEKDGKQYDLGNPNEDPLRPPVPNKWLLSHKLDVLNPAVLEQDPDSDGFSNVEEWRGGTSPIEAGEHPPYVNKLKFVERRRKPFEIKFAANNEPDFQVSVRGPRGFRKTDLYRVGEEFPGIDGGKFTILEFVPKKGVRNGIPNQDISELMVRDNASGKTIGLALKEEVFWPSYYARFTFELGRSEDERDLTVKVGDSFSLSLEPSRKFIVDSVEETSATLTPAGGGDEIVKVLE